MDTISLIIHVTAAVVLVGPQILLFLAVVPATWLIDDERLRTAVTRVVTRRFGMLAGIALVVLLITGLYQFYSVTPDAVSENMMDFRYGLIFTSKMTLLVVLVALIGYHAFVVGRQINDLSDRVAAGEAEPHELESKRRTSFMLSFFVMLLSIAVLALGVTLGHNEYAYVPTT